MLLCYITDRSQFAGGEVPRRKLLLEKIAEAAQCGVDFIQLRERDLTARELALLAEAAIRIIRDNSLRADSDNRPPTRLLINSRTDVAIACGADGVHLRSDDVRPEDVRKIWNQARQNPPVISVACHTVEEAAVAADDSADFVTFGAVFGKNQPESPGFGNVSIPGVGKLEEASGQKIPILALGGITVENAAACISAGAAGIAGIRLFQENSIARLVNRLKEILT